MSSARSALHAHSAPRPPSPRSKGNSKPLPRLEPSPLPLQPLENSSSARTPAFNLHTSGHRRPSPMKPSSRRQSVSQPGKGNLGFVPISAPTPPTFTTDSPTKKPPFQTFPHSSMSRSALFTTFSSVNPQPHSRKENFPVNESHDDGFADFPSPSYGSNPPLRRTLLDAAPLKERPAKKHKREDSTSTHLPEHYELPPVEDDGTKPPYSYATLIGMSILRAPNRRLTLAQIYKWISDTFKYYRKCDPGWQNSIRHNLSLNKAFVKQERPKDDPGKGNYWAIEAGMEGQFLKDKSFRRPTMSSLPLPAAPLGHHLRTSGTSTWAVPPPPHRSSALKSSKPVDLSSDATLPASDPALQEDAEESAHVPVSQGAPPRSSPPQHIHSSPPVAPPLLTRRGTPPSPSHVRTSSAAGDRPGKRKSTAMNDSGYFSSLESSVMRPNKAARLLTSDLDVEPPRIKRGRAEEEIARIRSSSHDISPNHGGGRRSSIVAVGSSPLRGEYISMLPPPLTPVFKVKKPVKPPTSVSPNTNLRNHRKKMQHMVQSPIKRLGLADDELPFSPAFKIQDELLTPNNTFHANFDVFADLENTLAYGSPEKRSAKRGTGTGGNVLTDITSVSVNSRMGVPSLSSNRSKALLFPDSPSKVSDPGRFVDATNDDFFSFHLFDESPGEIDGVDLLQGFQKIGGANKDESSRGRHPPRPTITPRSNTSLF